MIWKKIISLLEYIGFFISCASQKSPTNSFELLATDGYASTRFYFNNYDDPCEAGYVLASMIHYFGNGTIETKIIEDNRQAEEYISLVWSYVNLELARFNEGTSKPMWIKKTNTNVEK